MSEGSAVVGEVGRESEKMSERLLLLLLLGEEGEGGVRVIVVRWLSPPERAVRLERVLRRRDFIGSS